MTMGEQPEETRGEWIQIIIPSAIILICLLTIGWEMRSKLRQLVSARPATLPAAVLGLAVWLLLGGMTLIVRDEMLKEQLRRRVVERTGIAPLNPPTGLKRWLNRLPDPIEWIFQPMLQTRWGQQRKTEWEQAGFGMPASRYLVLIICASLLAGYLGFQLGGWPLALALTGLAPLAPHQWVSQRARNHRHQFSEQIPFALDALAAGISAGLSFQQSITFAVEELPQPIATSLSGLDRKIRLGHPVANVLRGWAEAHSDEALRLAVDGILLQRRLGGDLVIMLERTAKVARERNELQREVQAVTAQGRLSGWVIAGLVPVSAGLLLATNPAYIDILFNTLLGQALLVIALLLQLIGWFVISRLIRIEY